MALTTSDQAIEDLAQRIENLLFVIWIQDQRHDYYMKFIREIKHDLEELRDGISFNDDEREIESLEEDRKRVEEER